MKRPSFQFYPGDWLRDTALRSVSVSARGAWSDMLCLMHEGTPYGHLKVGSKVILPVNLSRMIGLTLEETERLIAELEEAGVFSRTAEGCIYSRRMVRDEEIREKRAKGGILGGNPALKVNGKVTTKVNLEGYPVTEEADADANAEEKESVNGDPIPKITKRMEKARAPLALINELRGGKHFLEVKSNLIPIATRLEEPGVEVDEVFKMLRRHWEKVKGTKWADYFTPESMFRPSNFHGLYANRNVPVVDENIKPTSWQRKEIQENIPLKML